MKKLPRKKKDDGQYYLAIGLVFIGVSFIYLFNESLRSMSVVFFCLGITFMILGTSSSEDSNAKKSKKSKK